MIPIHSTNHLLMSGDVDVMGGKTGFIRKSGYCLATLLRLPQGESDRRGRPRCALEQRPLLGDAAPLQLAGDEGVGAVQGSVAEIATSFQLTSSKGSALRAGLFWLAAGSWQRDPQRYPFCTAAASSVSVAIASTAGITWPRRVAAVERLHVALADIAAVQAVPAVARGERRDALAIRVEAERAR